MAGAKRGFIYVVSKAASGITRILTARSSKMPSLLSDYLNRLQYKSLTNVNLMKCNGMDCQSPKLTRWLVRRQLHSHSLSRFLQIRCRTFHLLRPRLRLPKACFLSCALDQLCCPNVSMNKVSQLCQLTISRTAFIHLQRFATCH